MKQKCKYTKIIIKYIAIIVVLVVFIVSNKIKTLYVFPKKKKYIHREDEPMFKLVAKHSPKFQHNK